MVSRRSLGGLDITIGGGGLRFKKRPSGYNIKIGKCMEGKPGPTNGGRYDKGFQKNFVQCAVQAGAKLSPAARTKWGV